jgi:hypothetical protein
MRLCRYRHVLLTDTDTNKMYDLEIHVYNDKDHTDTETFDYHYFVLVKNGTMNGWLVQELSEPGQSDFGSRTS